MSDERSDRLLMAAAFVGTLFVLLGLTTPAHAQGAPAHWSDAPNVQLEECDALQDAGQHAASMYCLERYQAAGVALWSDSTGPEFAEALPMLSVVGVFAVGLALGSGVVPR